MRRFLVSVLSLFVVLFSVSCSGAKAPGPAESFQQYLEALKSGNLEQAAQYVDGGIVQVEGMAALYEVATPFYAVFRAEVLKETVSGEEAALSVEITLPDQELLAGQVFAELAASGLSLDVLDESILMELVAIVDTLDFSAMDTTTDTVDISMLKKGDQWVLPQEYDLSSGIVHTFFP